MTGLSSNPTDLPVGASVLGVSTMLIVGPMGVDVDHPDVSQADI
jgi:hypothetical protein